MNDGDKKEGRKENSSEGAGEESREEGGETGREKEGREESRAGQESGAREEGIQESRWGRFEKIGCEKARREEERRPQSGSQADRDSAAPRRGLQHLGTGRRRRQRSIASSTATVGTFWLAYARGSDRSRDLSLDRKGAITRSED
jgi:hypothetical protein